MVPFYAYYSESAFTLSLAPEKLNRTCLHSKIIVTVQEQGSEQLRFVSERRLEGWRKKWN